MYTLLIKVIKPLRHHMDRRISLMAAHVFHRFFKNLGSVAIAIAIAIAVVVVVVVVAVVNLV